MIILTEILTETLTEVANYLMSILRLQTNNRLENLKIILC